MSHSNRKLIIQRIYLWLAVCLLISVYLVENLSAQELPESGQPWQGRPLAEVLDELRETGLPLVYSSSLVPDTLLITKQPTPSESLDMLREVVKPLGLDVQHLDGMYLVVRASSQSESSPETASLMVVINNADDLPATDLVNISAKPSLNVGETLATGVYQYRLLQPGSYEIEIAAVGYRTQLHPLQVVAGQTKVLKLELQLGPAELEDMSVSASRYILFSNSQFFIDQRAIQALPDLGEDPVRATHRLPGTASSGLSSRAFFRGGGLNETSIFLNGLQLVDPFHVRDYHNIFSTIDARAISGVEAYTGGFPSNYGDSMSGVLLLNSQRAASAPSAAERMRPKFRKS